MEQGRLLIAIALSFVVFLLWSFLFAPDAKKMETEPAQNATVTAEAEKTTSGSSPASIDEPIVEKPQQVVELARPARTVTVETDLYRMILSEKGAAVVSMVLKNYRETVDKNSPFKEMLSKDVTGGTVLFNMNGNKDKSLEQGLYQLDRSEQTLGIGSDPETIRFRFVDKNGIQVEKAFTFRNDSYLVGLELTVYNGSQQTLKDDFRLGLRQVMDEETQAYGFKGPSALINGSLEQVKVKDIEEQEKLSGKIRWAAVETRYFMTSLINPENVDATIDMAYKDGIVQNNLILKNGNLEPKQKSSLFFSLFMGPKSLSILRSLNNELDKAIDFGMFDFIAKPCLWFMNWIHKFIPNYGIAIIILTIVTRMIFWPLATKSYKSMSEMRKIQPLMQEIREKYKNDKTKMNQEMMGLYRTYKINPMGGCLPMLIQLPVFFALYQMLYQAIELRHAPFIWWINDLSAPDRLGNFDFTIPMMQAPIGIPVLTLVMGATMFLQQKMTPTPGDPAQAKMMMLMPIIFTFIFINFSSGLVLYWLVSNILSISQQYYTQKKLA